MIMVQLIDPSRLVSKSVVLLVLLALGCECNDSEPSAQPEPQPRAVQKDNAAASAEKTAPLPAGAKRAPLGKNVWLETHGQRRRVIVGATVCLREGNYGLECLLCRNRTKEHESIFTTDADAKVIHLALIAAGGQPGSPIQFVQRDGKYMIVPPSGSRVKVSVQYEDKGKSITVPAQQWVRNGQTKKELTEEWIFAGSQFLPNEDGDKQAPLYAATAEGAYICISNLTTALLDLPINSPRALEERTFEPYTERIPALDTKVFLILEPQADPKKQKK
jgi:hypothetical protein